MAGDLCQSGMSELAPSHPSWIQPILLTLCLQRDEQKVPQEHLQGFAADLWWSPTYCLLTSRELICMWAHHEITQMAG